MKLLYFISMLYGIFTEKRIIASDKKRHSPKISRQIKNNSISVKKTQTLGKNTI